MRFNSDGSINTERSVKLIRRWLNKLAIQPLESNLIGSMLKEVVQLEISPDSCLLECSEIEKRALRQTTLIESEIPLSRVGDKTLEWEFFQRRKEALPDDPATYAAVHNDLSRLVLQTIIDGLASCRRYETDIRFRTFMRCKSIPSARRKMRAKQLRSWEVGDYLGLTICPPSFREIEDAVVCIDREFADDVLYKQNGFADRLVDGCDLRGHLGRRIFYIVRFNDVVCFEVQIVTLRQLIFLQLDHPRYIGKPHTLNELESLESFGDKSYLLDLRELTGLDDTDESL